MYVDNNTACNKHVTTLKHKNNVKLNDGEKIKSGDRFDCVICTTTLVNIGWISNLKQRRIWIMLRD